mmetsp:Transcript_35832/g.55893  ORF Transcript_35832/g.55893 Transcript_35832/m.55893 type:complete len:145 (+) Transcript_35832:389-823(+)
MILILGDWRVLGWQEVLRRRESPALRRARSRTSCVNRSTRGERRMRRKCCTLAFTWLGRRLQVTAGRETDVSGCDSGGTEHAPSDAVRQDLVEAYREARSQALQGGKSGLAAQKLGQKAAAEVRKKHSKQQVVRGGPSPGPDSW